jgi:hypothetical protein
MPGQAAGSKTKKCPGRACGERRDEKRKRGEEERLPGLKL